MLPKPKRKRTFYKKNWFVCIMTAVLTAALCMSGFALIITRADWIRGTSNKSNAGVDTAADISQTQAFFKHINDRKDKEELSGPAIYEKIHSSIVSIETKGTSGGFLNSSVTVGSGSGIILSKDGYIVTNNHVIADATEVTVTLSTGKVYNAKPVAKDTETDLAVIKIDATDLPAATLGDSDNLLVGDKAYAIGNPLGKNLYSSFTGGFVSGLNRSLNIDGESGNFIQTDTAINPGNSGGALVNSYGEVVGINTIKYSGENVEGIGFAIPINDAKLVVDELIKKGYVSGRPLVGLIDPKTISQAEKEYYDLSDSGIYITSLASNGGAEKAGLKVGDVITYFDGARVKTVEELNTLKDKHKAGDTVDVTINRDGKVLQKKLTLTEDKPDVTASQQTPNMNKSGNKEK